MGVGVAIHEPDDHSTDEQRRRLLLAELRRQGIADERVLAAIERVPRSFFVEPELQIRPGRTWRWQFRTSRRYRNRSSSR